MIRIGLIECGRNLDRWTAEYGGFADWFPPFLGLAGDALEFETFRADLRELPATPEACDAWLLTGSPASVYEDLPWQTALTAFVRRAAPLCPIIGICYGHQHLHAALGGAVAKDAQWGVGIQTYAIAELPAWLPADVARDSAAGLRLIALHQDQVTAAAPGSRLLAGNPACPLGVTTIGENVLTFQAHPEMAPGQASEIYDFHRQRIGPARAESAKASLAGPRDDLLAARWIVAFLEHRLAQQEQWKP